MTKRRGERGHPCRMPCSWGNRSEEGKFSLPSNPELAVECGLDGRQEAAVHHVGSECIRECFSFYSVKSFGPVTK